LAISPTVPVSVGAHARRRSAAPAVTAIGRDGDADTLSYGELESRSRRLAGWLRHELSIPTGGPLALLPTNDLRSVVALLGALRSGARVVVLNPGDPPGRLREQADALGAGTILAIPDLPDPPELPELPDTPTAEDPAPLDPDAEALLVPTSGSTAAAKVVAQSHYAAAVNAAALRRHHRLVPGDRILGCLPVHHVNGLHFTLFASLAAGAHALLLDGFDPLTYATVIERFRPRLASVVPSILEALVEVRREATMPPGFEYFVSAAAPLPARTARALATRLGTRVLQGYGLTETVNFSTTLPADLTDAGYRELVLDAGIPSIGTPLFGNEVAVLRPDGSRAAPGETGELCVRGHNVMVRYVGNPRATEAAFRHGWFHSQDLGFEVEHSPDGRRHFVVTGRAKHVAKVGGESVSLEEVERALRALPSVRDAACTAFPHRFVGDEIVAGVVLSGPRDLAELRTVLAGTLPASAIPRRIVPLPAIPRTPTGKVIRAALTEELKTDLEQVRRPE
jgi:acyl-CoA synthetase (AMP-forming)/AMP-acid ligase II